MSAIPANSSDTQPVVVPAAAGFIKRNRLTAAGFIQQYDETPNFNRRPVRHHGSSASKIRLLT
jgi:hypothetical protein